MAKSQDSAAQTTPAQFAFRKVANVTVPLLSLKDLFEVPIYVRIETPFETAKPTKNDTKEPPTICRVTNLETGELCQLIVPVVLKSELNENFPDAGYVGKCFELIKHKIEGDKKYSTWGITEIVPE